jgi:hypothetical protein
MNNSSSKSWRERFFVHIFIMFLILLANVIKYKYCFDLDHQLGSKISIRAQSCVIRSKYLMI